MKKWHTKYVNTIKTNQIQVYFHVLQVFISLHNLFKWLELVFGCLGLGCHRLTLNTTLSSVNPDLRKLNDCPDDPYDGEGAADDGHDHDPESVVDAAAALV